MTPAMAADAAGDRGRGGRARTCPDGRAAYNPRMGSIADSLRQDTRRRVLRLAPEARLALGHRLADADVDLYCAAHGVSKAEARRVFVAARQVGRRPSRSVQDLRR